MKLQMCRIQHIRDTDHIQVKLVSRNELFDFTDIEEVCANVAMRYALGSLVSFENVPSTSLNV